MAYIPADARWYLADVVMETRVAGDARNVVHVNVHLVEADSPAVAYGKAVALGREAEQSYENTDGHAVSTVFRVLRGLNMIHGELVDGAELTYEESVDVPEAKLAELVTPREELGVFAERRDGFERGLSNYMHESVMKLLEEAGFDRTEMGGNRPPDGT